MRAYAFHGAEDPKSLTTHKATGALPKLWAMPVRAAPFHQLSDLLFEQETPYIIGRFMLNLSTI